MSKHIRLSIVAAVFCCAGFAFGQETVMDMVASKVIGKYQSASCEQLWQQRGQPKSAQEQEAVNFLRNDPTARAAFINKIAAPIANKLFECGMIP
jgi:hypothetical protein